MSSNNQISREESNLIKIQDNNFAKSNLSKERSDADLRSQGSKSTTQQYNSQRQSRVAGFNRININNTKSVSPHDAKQRHPNQEVLPSAIHGKVKTDEKDKQSSQVKKPPQVPSLKIQQAQRQLPQGVHNLHSENVSAISTVGGVPSHMNQ